MAVLFLLYVIVEVAAIWAISSAIGFLATIALLVAGAVLGSWLARREGARSFRTFMETARAGRPAQDEITNGMLIALGGLLIMIPGFVSDLAGLLLLLPPTRSLFRKAWTRRSERRAVARANQQRGPVVVVEGEVVEGEVVSGQVVNSESGDGEGGRESRPVPPRIIEAD
jgi:UPF0716 protein FxsA